MIKIISIVGARPQFIKHAPLSIKLDEFFEHKSIHTGQHYDENMSDLFFKTLNIRRPDYFLKDIGNYKTHGGQTGHMLMQIENILIQEKPNYVLVYGDTNSTLAAALAAVKLNIKIIHIESGLRSYNNEMPEEINRILTDKISDLLFCSTVEGEKNLKNELVNGKVIISGDIMKDSLELVSDNIDRIYDFEYILTTIHRPYNTDDKSRLKSILENLNNLKIKVIFPIHPRTSSLMNKYDLKQSNYNNIEFIEPAGYKSFMGLLNFCNAIVTDSGGVQKEAYMLKKKCVTVRSETEWIETLIGDWNELVFEDLNKLEKAINNQPNSEKYNKEIYGKGSISKKIAKEIKDFHYENSNI